MAEVWDSFIGRRDSDSVPGKGDGSVVGRGLGVAVHGTPLVSAFVFKT